MVRGVRRRLRLPGYCPAAAKSAGCSCVGARGRTGARRRSLGRAHRRRRTSRPRTRRRRLDTSATRRTTRGGRPVGRQPTHLVIGHRAARLLQHGARQQHVLQERVQRVRMPPLHPAALALQQPAYARRSGARGSARSRAAGSRARPCRVVLLELRVLEHHFGLVRIRFRLERLDAADVEDLRHLRSCRASPAAAAGPMQLG
jgi:hypothetical protein